MHRRGRPALTSSDPGSVDLSRRARRRVTTRPKTGLVALAALLAAFCGAGAYAQSLEPRSYSELPVGMNFLGVGYSYASGGVTFDPSVPITNAQITTNTEAVAYVRSFGLWSKSAKFDVVAPVVSLTGSADVDGQSKTRDIAGLADPAFRFSLNFIGAPALNLEQFHGYRQDLIVGASLRVTAPWGQYDDTRLVNIGTNRWSYKPELGISKALGSWTCDMYAGATFYSENDQFLRTGTVQQDPLYSMQAHVVRNLPRGVWVAADATYYWGGRTTVNGRRTDTLQANSRFGLTVALPLNRHNSIKLYGATGVSSRTHANFNDAGIAWQYRWGAGL